MKNIDYIAEGIKLIERNLKEPLQVFDIARKIGYSYFYFSRIFHAISGISTKEYIQKRRLTLAAEELINTDRKIIDIALEFQFSSHEAFSRAVKSMFGLTPLEMRKKRATNFRNILSPLDLIQLNHLTDIKRNEPEIVTLEEFIVKGYCCFMAEKSKTPTITYLWEQFIPEIPHIKNQMTPHKAFQICFWSEEINLQGLFMMAGVQVKDFRNFESAYVYKVIPKNKYLKFIHKGPANKVGLTYLYIYQNFLPKSEYISNQAYNLEYYPENYLGPYNPECESIIYIPVK